MRMAWLFFLLMTIFALDMKSVSLTEISPTKFAALGVKERDHLQRALRDNIGVISRDLMVLAEEYGQWEDARRRIDLLCLDTKCRIVVVELKRAEDGAHSELQALRYAAMIAAMSFRQAVDAYAAHLAKNGKDPADAEGSIRQFLDVPEGEVELSNKVRVLLAGPSFSREITSTVLWLNVQGLDITCVRLQPHQVGDKLLLDVQQLLPLPEAQAYQVAIRDKVKSQEKVEENGRDFTKYEVTTSYGTSTGLPKRRFMFEVVREAIKKQGLSPEKIAEAVSWRRNTMFVRAEGTVTGAKLLELVGKDPRRFFSDEDEIFHAGGQTYALSNQWGTSTEDAARNIIKLLPAGTIKFRPMSSN
jgi:hypothetical protein